MLAPQVSTVHRLVRVGALSLCIAGVLVAASFVGAFSGLRGMLSDALMVGYVPPQNIVIVAIDDASLRAVGRWPWRRNVHADLIDTIAAAGPRAIGYDVNFPEPSCAPGETEVFCADDTLLAAAIGRTGNVILPLEATFVPQPGQDAPLAVRPITPIPELTAAATLGFVNTPPDGDGIFRRVPLSVGGIAAERNQPFFRAVLGRAFPEQRFPETTGPLVIHFAGPKGTFQTVSAADVLTGQVDPQLFNQAIVFVGATAPDLHDVLLTPTAKREPMSGIEVHANALATVLTGRALHPVPQSVLWGSIVLMSLLAGFLVSRFRLRYALPGVAILLVGYLLAALLLAESYIIFDLLFVPLALLGSAGAALIERVVFEKIERTRTQTILERYVSPSVVRALVAQPKMLTLGGERRDMSVLFSDLRGFTSLSEGLKPEELVAVLNRYLSEMTDIVFAHNGVIDKYMGDAIMAFWGAPLADDTHAVHAVQAALAMRRRLAALNSEAAFPAGIRLAVGVGINTGPMVVGNMGSEKRFDYTVMGDSVNLGSRVEGLNKDYGTDILVTASTAAQLGDTFLLMAIDRVAVKGKKEPVEIFFVVEEANRASEPMRQFAQDFTAARTLYLAREFGQAQDAFSGLVQSHPHDALAQLYVTRCEHFLNQAPPQDWDGATVKKTK